MSWCWGHGVVGVVVHCGDVVVMWLLWIVVWLLLVSYFGMREGVAHCVNITRNDERQHRRRLSLCSHIAHSDMAPSILIDVAACLLGDVVLPCGPRCCGCGRWMCVAVAIGDSGEVGVMDDDGG